MKFSFVSLLTKLTLATTVAGALASCDDPTYPTPNPVTASTVGQARVLVVNAAPGSQGVTITLENLAFGTVTPYLGSPVATYTPVDAGLRLFVFNDPANIPATPATATTAGVKPLTTPRALISRTSFSGGMYYTVFLTDQPTRAYAYPVIPNSDQGGIRTLILTDNLSAPAVERSRVRFINVSPSLTAKDDNGFGLFLTATSSTTATDTFLFTPTGRGYRSTSYTVPKSSPAQTTDFTKFTEVMSGAYKLDVRASATATPNVPAQIFTFASGKIYTVYVRGERGNAAAPLGLSVVEHN